MISDPENSPIIIFGAPRSGTTYLSEILNQHPDIAITNETRLMVWLHKALNILPYDDEAIYNDRPDFICHLQKELPYLIRRFYREVRPRARYWGDKNPHYGAPQHSGCLETVAALFPGTHFIHIIRDGREVVSSILRMGWADFDDAHLYWKNQLDAGCAFGQTQSPEQYMEIRYEELIANDAGLTREMFAFLGIEMHPAVENFCKLQQTNRTPAGFPTRDLSAGVTKTVWGELLAREEQVRSLENLGEYLIRYGYESAASLKKKQQILSGAKSSSLI